MFNFNAETFVIVYPFGAGGFFLQKMMSLDNQTTAMHNRTLFIKDRPNFFSGRDLFAKCKYDLEHGRNNAKFIDIIDQNIAELAHVFNYDPTIMPKAKRYVFCIHQTEIPLANSFLKQCKDLKIIIINTSTENSLRQMATRRKFLLVRDNIVLDDYNIHYDELQTIKMFNNTVKLKFGAHPVFNIEMEDYWDPEKAIPLINTFFEKYNLKCNNWEELYHIWHNNAIKIPLNANNN